ncbi:hypothetical protein JCM10207_003710 [Rhodosporidiobolus poonsookiae]
MTTDRLTALPVELLEHICALVHAADPHLYLGRISSAFVPLARQLVFRKVRTSGSRQLARLCDLVEGADGVGAAVKELVIYCGAEYWPDREVELPATRFTALLTRLSSLVHLSFNGAARLIEIFLQPETAKHCKKLEHLHVFDCFKYWSHPFEAARWTALRHCPQLYTLEITAHRSDTGDVRSPSQLSVPERIKSRFLWDVSLKGRLTGNPGVSDLLSMLPPCHSLTLTDRYILTWEGKPQLADILRAVPSPKRLEALDVSGSDKTGRASDDILLRFSNLADLALDDLAYDPASFSRLALPPALKSLTLYGHTTDLAARDIKPLLADPKRVPALESLTLDTIRVRDGDEFVAEEPVTGVPVVDWTDDFSFKDMQELVKIARERGVQFDGDAVWIVQDDNEWTQYESESDRDDGW